MNDLCQGQRIRVTRYTLESGAPARQARITTESTSEGVITKIERLRGIPNTVAVTYTDGHSELVACMSILPAHGLLLKDFCRGQEIEILQQAPTQQRLFELRAA